MSDEEIKKYIISEIQRIAKEQNSKSITRNSFKQNSNISQHQIYRLFGSWNEAVKASGLKPISKTVKLSERELFEELLNVCNKLNKIPSTLDIDRDSKYNSTTYTKRRYGNWPNTLLNFNEWLKNNYPDSKYIELIEEKYANKSQCNKTVKLKKQNDINKFEWESTSNIRYGAPMDFRGLRHEPINEQGVVFLFGKVSEELGFSIEAIKTGFPDCEGKRLVNKNKGHWEKVLIEFEYLSKNFKEHGHNTDQCCTCQVIRLQFF